MALNSWTMKKITWHVVGNEWVEIILLRVLYSMNKKANAKWQLVSCNFKGKCYIGIYGNQKKKKSLFIRYIFFNFIGWFIGNLFFSRQIWKWVSAHPYQSALLVIIIEERMNIFSLLHWIKYVKICTQSISCNFNASDQQLNHVKCWNLFQHIYIDSWCYGPRYFFAIYLFVLWLIFACVQ